MIQKREKESCRPVWVDWVILLLVVIIVLLGARYLYTRKNATLPTVAVEFTLCLPAQSTDFADFNGGWESLIPIGTTVTNANGTAQLGTVTALSLRPHTVPTVLDGVVVTVEQPGTVDLFVTVRGMATVKVGDGLRIRDIRIAAGDRGDFRIGSFLASGSAVVFVKKEEAHAS